MTVRLSTALLIVVSTVVALAVGYFAFTHWQEFAEARERAADRETTLELAITEVTELTTLNAENLDDRLESLNSRLTGEFSQQFQAMYSTFASVVHEYGVSSDGTVHSAGLVSLGQDEAVVIVAVQAEVTGPEQEAAERSYRFEVAMVKQDSAWLISEMSFVS